MRHCEERSDEAIQSRVRGPGLLRFARNDDRYKGVEGNYSAASLAAPRPRFFGLADFSSTGLRNWPV